MIKYQTQFFKITFSLLLIGFSLNISAQDTSQVNQIDQLVQTIDKTKLFRIEEITEFKLDVRADEIMCFMDMRSSQVKLIEENLTLVSGKVTLKYYYENGSVIMVIEQFNSTNNQISYTESYYFKDNVCFKSVVEGEDTNESELIFISESMLQNRASQFSELTSDL